MEKQKQILKGRGSGGNVPNRFEKIVVVPDDEFTSDGVLPKTKFYWDRAQSILSQNDSPDLPFKYGLNPYRGCEHGCIYCYARPTHEYLGLSSGLDFETKIFVKKNAPELLREKLNSPSWRGELISLSGVTDCYQPAEKQLQITRGCLQVLSEFLNPVGIITKNRLIMRDLDFLKPLAAAQAVVVYISITTLNEDLRKIMEPRTSSPPERLRAIQTLSQAGIPVGVLVAPVIPGLTDHEMPKILQAAEQHGARFAGYSMLRLPYSVKTLFETWLGQHLPESKQKVLNQMKAISQGRMNRSEFGVRMRGEGVFADAARNLFRITCNRLGLLERAPKCSSKYFHKDHAQLNFLDQV